MAPRRSSINVSTVVATIGVLAVAIAAVISTVSVLVQPPIGSRNNQPPQPQSQVVIQFPPWWEILAFIGGLLALVVLIFLAAGPAVLYLRKYYRKFYVPAFSDELPSEIEKVAQVNPADIQQVVATQLAISSNYYETVLQQSKRSFLAAIIFASVGLGFFMAGISFIVYRNPADFANPSIIGGALTEFLSAINFYLYGRTTRQLETFHIRLDGIQRFVIANSVCENLEGEIKQTTRAELVQAMFAYNAKYPAPEKDNSKDNGFRRTRRVSVRRERN